MRNTQPGLFGQEKSAEPKPFLKWAGGKTQLLEQITPLLPKQFTNYYEPFVGGSAVFFHLVNLKKAGFIDFGKVTLSDANGELINTYSIVRNKPVELIEFLKKLKTGHNKQQYYEIRAQKTEALSEVERAARFIYLNKTCYNGLYRVNSKGQFNVPIGSYKNPQIFSEDNIYAVSKALADVNIKLAQFSDITDWAEAGDFVYFDPPYQPLSKTSSFTGYTDLPFGEEQQIALRDVATNLTHKKVKVMVSNSWVEFILALYKDFNCKEVKAARMINCASEKRGAISELVAVNYDV